MRRTLCLAALPLMLLAAPVAAQGVDPLDDPALYDPELAPDYPMPGDPVRADGPRGGLADAIPHPYDVEAAGDRLSRSVGALMDVPVGDVVRSFDPYSRVPRDATLGEVAGRGDPASRGAVEDQVSAMSLKLADAMRLLRARAPGIERSLRDLERNLAGAVPRD